MRLDHLLSKENIVIVCFVAGWVLVSAWLVTKFFRHCGVLVSIWWWRFLFSGESKCHTHFMCGVLGSMEQRQGEAFSAGWPVGGVLQGNVFVFWFVLFVWHAVGCLGQHKYCCSIDHPLMKQDLFGWVLCVGWCVV